MTQESRLIQRKPLRGVVTVAALAAGVAGGYALKSSDVVAQNAGTPGNSAPVVQTPASRDAVSIQSAFSDVARVAEPAVVTITTESGVRTASTRRTPRGGQGNGQPNPFGGGDPFDEFQEFFRNFGLQPNSFTPAQKQQLWRQIQDRRGGGLGSGMIYRSDGLILTNAHVVKGAETVTVTLNNEREFKKAKVLGIDERTDVAVVKINATNLPTVKFGDSTDVKVGDWAIAVGNPYGLSHTVTVGVISATAREVPLDARTPGDYLQTDASINPGNSGGPLLDINGRVIGINNAIYSQSGGNVGIGFAIPVNTARQIADRLVRDGKITRGYLGVSISNAADNGQAFGLDAGTKGVLVQEVSPDTPGGRAGLQPGDVIQAFNGQEVTRSSELQRLVGDAPVNSTVALRVLRGTQTVTVNAKLEALPDENKPATNAEPRGGNDEGVGPTTLGMRLSTITPQLARRYNLPADARGVVVSAVQPNGPADQAGIKAGDLIERVAQKPVTTPQELQAEVTRILNRQTEDKAVALYVNSNGTRRFAVVNANN